MLGVPDKVSRQLRAAGDVTTLDSAVQRARLLFMIEEPAHNDGVAVIATDDQHSKLSGLNELKQQVAELTEQIASLATSVP